MPRLLRRFAQLTVVLLCAALLPPWWAARGSVGLYEGRAEAVLPLARGVLQRMEAPAPSFHTGSARFDGEWAFVSAQMSALGLGQVILEHPEQRAALLPGVHAALERMLQPSALAFGVEPWGDKALRPERGHAWMGYLNMALSMARRLEGDAAPHAALNDQLSAALAARLLAEPIHALETYPGEVYPADISTIIGSLGLYQAATGRDMRAAIQRGLEGLERFAVEPKSGLLYQSLSPKTGRPRDHPRASGTAFSVYFLAFADPAFSARLYRALAGQARAPGGFGLILEYPPGHEGAGDIDSGPLIFGASPSATAFSVAGARIHRDQGLYTALYRTARTMGAPVDRGEARTFLLGGPLGDALMLAMLSAGPR